MPVQIDPASVLLQGYTMSDTSKPAQSKLRSLILNLMLVCAGLGVAGGLGELAVRAAFRSSMDFDMEMWKYATQIKVRSDDPRLVHEHRPNRQAFLMGVEVTTNSFGLRDKPRTKVTPPNTYRIVALGDSITMGWGVEQTMTYPAQLENMLNTRPPQNFPPGLHYEVLNLGVGNYNTDQEVMRLKNLGLSFNPDLITLGYFINDAEPTPRPSVGFLIEHSYLSAFMASRIRLSGPGPISYLDYYRSLYEDTQPGWQATQAAIRELASISGSHSIPVMIFIIPEMHKPGANYPFADVHRKVEKVGIDAGFPVIDLLAVFDGRKPDSTLWVSPLDAHHNADAQALLAKGMYNALEVHGRLLSPRASRLSQNRTVKN